MVSKMFISPRNPEKRVNRGGDTKTSDIAIGFVSPVA
jgi:hypothetical protein